MTKSTTFTAFICLFTTCLLAQSSIKYGISINPNYSYRYFFSDIAGLKKSFDNIDVGKFSYSMGGFGEKHINNQVRLRVGINLMNTGSGTRKQDFTTWNSTNPNGGIFPQNPIDPNAPIAGRFIFNYIKIELPIDFQFFINKKHAFYISSGLSPIVNIYNYSIFKSYFADGKIKKNNNPNNDPDIKKIELAAQIGIGYEVKLNQKLTLDIQPRYQYFLTDLMRSTQHSGIIKYNVGMQMGLKF